MPAYAYPIKVDRNRKIFTENVYHALSDELMTLADIKDLVGDNRFSIEAGCEENVVEQSVILCVRKEREETDEEYESRIQREEAYMAEYKRRQNSYKYDRRSLKRQ